MVAILAPTNIVSLLFLDKLMGKWVALLAVGGLVPNLVIVVYERGFSKRLAIPHIIFWTFLVGFLVFAKPEFSGIDCRFLRTLLAVDDISLIFDYPDALKWIKGQRKIFGR